MQVNDPAEVHPIKSPLYSWPHTSDGSHSALLSTSIMFPWYVYFPTILVFYCCVTHYQKPNGFRHPCIISQSVGQKFRWAQLVLWSGSYKAKLKVLARLAVMRTLGARFHFQAHLVVARVQFLMATGVRSLFPCWLLVGLCFLLLEAAHSPSHVASGGAMSHPCASNLCLPLLPLARESSLLLRTHVIS